MTSVDPPEPVPAPSEHAPAHHRVHLTGVDGKPGASLALPLAFSSAFPPERVTRFAGPGRGRVSPEPLD
jgi:hypothetical protein